MRDLKKESGLSVYLKDDFKLDLDIKLLGGEFSSRTIADMEPVLKDEIKISSEPLYFMYRDVHERVDDEKIRNNKLRYDMTVLLPKMIGSEFNKTYGHYHPQKEGADITYPEVYEVISGKALFLMQKQGRNDDEIEEAYLIEVNEGEKIVMPPNFGHIAINPLNVPIVMSNWVDSGFSSAYELYEKNKGGVYYFVRPDEGDGWKKVKNTNYKEIPNLILGRPKELPRLALEFNKPLYTAGSKNIKKLEYLVNPQKFVDLLSPEAVFSF